MKLMLSPHLKLPLESVTQTLGILAKRRAGKSYLARKVAEQLFLAGQQIVVVDPKGDWYGIRSSADGKAPGLPVVILGGERADVKLESSAGEVVAKLIVEERVSALLDLSLFRKHEVATFMAIFLETLYRLKARDAFRTPMMLIVDEADAIAPQRPMKGEERMLGAAEDIVRRGGQRGIGCTLITQRSAVLNKNVLTQVQILIALRTIAPQDLAAMDAWIDVHGTQQERKTLMESLPALPIGDAWVWSPGWPTVDGIFQRIHVDPIQTFDSGSTPKPGEKRIEPKTVADIDLASVQRQMAATIEKAKADDPRELRKRITELTAELGRLAKAAPQRAPVPEKAVDLRPKLEAAASAATDAANRRWLNMLTGFQRRLAVMQEQAARLSTDFQDAAKIHGIAAPDAEPKSKLFFLNEQHELPRPTKPVTSPVAREKRTTESDGELSKVERRFLTVLAQRGKQTTRNQVAIFAGYSARSRHVDNTLSSLRSKSMIFGRGEFVITDTGLAAVGDFQPLPHGEELRQYWIAEVGTAAGAMLKELIEVYPQTLTRDEVAERANYSVTSRHVDNCLSRLRSMELIEGRGDLKASGDLFE